MPEEPNISDDTVERESIADIEDAFKHYLDPNEVAAVIIEPIQGDGGILPAHPIFLHKLYDLCKKHGILFISEEVQQGFFRTGHWFSIENYPDIIPDGIILGKSIGGGLTLGAFMARVEIIDSLKPPAHMFTLGGNPLSCAAGIAAFDIYQSNFFQETLSKNEKLLKELLRDLAHAHPDIVKAIHGKGLSQGIEISNYAVNGKMSGTDNAFKIAFRSFELGLLMITLNGNVLRVQPPLNIEEKLLLKGVKIIDQAIVDLKAGKISNDVLSFAGGW